MPQISLTEFVDIASRSGGPKATKVAQVKARPDYDPVADFYKRMRESIIDIHRNGQDAKALAGILTGLTDAKKRANYPGALNGYTKWWGKKGLVWFEPPHAKYARHGVEVNVNPELGLVVDGIPYVIKLYLKKVPLSKFQVEVVPCIMESALRIGCTNNEVMAILDVRNAKLFTYEPAARTPAMVDAELAYIASIWPDL